MGGDKTETGIYAVRRETAFRCTGPSNKLETRILSISKYPSEDWDSGSGALNASNLEAIYTRTDNFVCQWAHFCN